MVCLLFCRQSLLLLAMLCIGIFAGYYLLRDTVPGQGGPNADSPSGTPEIVRRYEDNPDDTIARLQQRLAQAEQVQLSLAERVAALEVVAGEPEI